MACSPGLLCNCLSKVHGSKCVVDIWSRERSAEGRGDKERAFAVEGVAVRAPIRRWVRPEMSSVLSWVRVDG